MAQTNGAERRDLGLRLFEVAVAEGLTTDVIERVRAGNLEDGVSEEELDAAFEAGCEEFDQRRKDKDSVPPIGDPATGTA